MAEHICCNRALPHTADALMRLAARGVNILSAAKPGDQRA